MYLLPQHQNYPLRAATSHAPGIEPASGPLMIPLCYIEDIRKQPLKKKTGHVHSSPGWWRCALGGVGRAKQRAAGSGVPHREPSVLHVIVEAVAGDLGASQVSSQLPGEGGGGLTRGRVPA